MRLPFYVGLEVPSAVYVSSHFEVYVLRGYRVLFRISSAKNTVNGNQSRYVLEY